ncbi:MAG: TetR/AcrR family transcriptional regulator [Gammaproteobacteria bacterium]|nr:TetR/AcrR family transcriptional regulator [Gammaproteobacteria bacterium]
MHPSEHQHGGAGHAGSCPAAESILAVAEQLFSEKGYEATSMSELAQRAGVSKANIFHHFHSKRELYLAVMQAACKDSRQALLEIRAGNGSTRERLAGFMRRHLRNMLDNEEVSRLVLREVLESGPERGRELAGRVFAEGFQQLVETVREGQERGELRPDTDPALVAHLIISTGVFFFQGRAVARHLHGAGFIEDPDDYAAQVADVLFDGCLAAHAENRPAPRPPERKGRR